MNVKHEELTAGERRFLEHARRAQREGLPLSEYCRSNGLSPYALYNMRRQLREKGILPPKSSPSAAPEQAAAGPLANRFVAVRVAEAPQAAPTSPAGMVCRLRHASGWLIECGAWPPSSWLREIVREVSDARS